MSAVWLDVADNAVLSRVELVMLDVEGCLTDGLKLLTGDGDIVHRYSSIDGLGVWLLGRAGVKVALVSSSAEPSIQIRATQMEVFSCAIDVANKRSFLENLMGEAQAGAGQTCVMGDDLWDYSAMIFSGLSVCPRDARPEIIDVATYRTRSKGGKGAVRELADRLLHAKGYSTDDLVDLLAR